MLFSTVALSALLGLASAQVVHVVSVSSSNNSLIFSPDNISAKAGEMVQFQFLAGNHSVVQSNFDNPCTPIAQHVANATGFYSGYQPVAASASTGMIPTYTIMIASTTPMWVYCSQAKHCQAGMVMVINENTSANATRSLANFKSLASKAAANVAPGSTSGGSSTGSGSGTTGSTATATGSSAASTSTAATGSGNIVAASSSLSLLGLAAAFFML